MLKILINEQDQVIQCDDYYVRQLANGLDEVIFNVSIYDPLYPYITEEAKVTDIDGQIYLVKQIDAGKNDAGILNRPCRGYGGSAGQMHQLIRWAVGPQDAAEIYAHPGRGAEAAAHTAPPTGLETCNEYGSMGRSGFGQQLCLGVSGICDRIPMQSVPPGTLCI